MAKFLALHRSSTSAQEQMANVTPEQAQAGLEAWQAWAAKAGPAIVDLGAPVSGDADITASPPRLHLAALNGRPYCDHHGARLAVRQGALRRRARYTDAYRRYCWPVDDAKEERWNTGSTASRWLSSSAARSRKIEAASIPKLLADVVGLRSGVEIGQATFRARSSRR